MRHFKQMLVVREWPAFLAALILLSPFLFWSFDRRSPVTTISVSVVPPEVRAGDILYRIVTIERRRICETDPDIVIVDGAKTRWRIDEGAITTPGAAGRDSYKVPIPVPAAAAPGNAELRVTVSRRCNPVQQMFPLVEVVPAIPFVILPAGHLNIP